MSSKHKDLGLVRSPEKKTEGISVTGSQGQARGFPLHGPLSKELTIRTQVDVQSNFIRSEQIV